MGYEEGSQFLIFFKNIFFFYYGCKMIPTIAAVSFIKQRFSI